MRDRKELGPDAGWYEEDDEEGDESWDVAMYGFAGGPEHA